MFEKSLACHNELLKRVILPLCSFHPRRNTADSCFRYPKLCPLNSSSSQWWFKLTNDSLRFWSECLDQDSATLTLIPRLTDSFYEFRNWKLVLCVEACLNSHQLYMNLWVKSADCYISFTPTPATGIRRATLRMFLDSIRLIGARSHILCGWNDKPVLRMQYNYYKPPKFFGMCLEILKMMSLYFAQDSTVELFRLELLFVHAQKNFPMSKKRELYWLAHERAHHDCHLRSGP